MAYPFKKLNTFNMKSLLLSGLLIFLMSMAGFCQNMYNINIEEVPQPPNPPICITSCEDCGKLIFMTFLSNLTFESDMKNVVEQKVKRDLNVDGIEKFTYEVTAKALPIQHIIIKGPNLVDYDLTVTNLEPVTCQNFLINTIIPVKQVPVQGEKEQTGKLFISTVPTGATISVNGTLQAGSVTPYTLEKTSGSYRITLKKDGYSPLDTTITLLSMEEGGTMELRASLRTQGPPVDLQSIRKEIKKHGNKQAFWGVATLAMAGAGVYFMITADQKYETYQNTSDNTATDLRKTAELYDKLAPSFFGASGVCALNYVIQSIVKSKSKKRLSLQSNGKELSLSYNF